MSNHTRQNAERVLQLYREIDAIHRMRDKRIRELRDLGFSIGEPVRINKPIAFAWCTPAGELGCNGYGQRCSACPLGTSRTDATLLDISDAMGRLTNAAE